MTKTTSLIVMLVSAMLVERIWKEEVIIYNIVWKRMSFLQILGEIQFKRKTILLYSSQHFYFDGKYECGVCLDKCWLMIKKSHWHQWYQKLTIFLTRGGEVSMAFFWSRVCISECRVNTRYLRDDTSLSETHYTKCHCAILCSTQSTETFGKIRPMSKIYTVGSKTLRPLVKNIFILHLFWM